MQIVPVPLLRVRFLLLLLLLSAQPVFAQNSIPDKYVLIYAEPLPLVDFINGTSYRLGGEWGFSKKWSVYGGAGGYFEQGYFIRTGIRRVVKVDGNYRNMVGIEFINSWHVHRDRDNYTTTDSATGELIRIESEPVTLESRKNINALSLTYSEQRFLSHRWVMEYFCAVGVRYRKAVINLPESELNKLYDYNESQLVYSSFRWGDGFTLDLRAGIRIGRRL